MAWHSPTHRGRSNCARRWRAGHLAADAAGGRATDLPRRADRRERDRAFRRPLDARFGSLPTPAGPRGARSPDRGRSSSSASCGAGAPDPPRPRRSSSRVRAARSGPSRASTASGPDGRPRTGRRKRHVPGLAGPRRRRRPLPGRLADHAVHNCARDRLHGFLGRRGDVDHALSGLLDFVSGALGNGEGSHNTLCGYDIRAGATGTMGAPRSASIAASRSGR